jgi:hypothetical protein
VKFLITRKCQYTETLEVEADSQAEAWEKSQDADFERVHDDSIVDEEITQMKEAS